MWHLYDFVSKNTDSGSFRSHCNLVADYGIKYKCN